jgi:hypothetical protein
MVNNVLIKKGKPFGLRLMINGQCSMFNKLPLLLNLLPVFYLLYACPEPKIGFLWKI